MTIAGEAMSYQVVLVEGYPAGQLGDIARLAASIDRFDLPAFEQQLRHREVVLNCFAYVDGELVGYKIGFGDRPGYFESWVGAVAQEHRCKGLATALMAAQHEWCAKAGFAIVSTVTTGDNRAMLIANLKAGFEICGTFWDRRKILKVILQKSLKE